MSRLTYLRQKRLERKRILLGDAVEKVAQPIAGAIDKVAGTNIKGCGGCKKRKEWLNNLTK
jgi:hypothetical protein